MKKFNGFFWLLFILCVIFMLSGLSVANVSESKKIQILEKYGEVCVFIFKSIHKIGGGIKHNQLKLCNLFQFFFNTI
jgi:hypothetical protein